MNGTATAFVDQAMKYRILLVDDHPVIRRGLAGIIQREADLEVCGEAVSAVEALALTEQTEPNLALVDVTLQEGDGIALTEQLQERFPRTRTLIFSVHDELLFAERALCAGARGYVSKDAATDELLRAIRQVLRGELCFSPRISERLRQRQDRDMRPTEDPVGCLSKREAEVFEMIGDGKTIRQIAKQLGLSAKTVESHRAKIKGKLRVLNSAELSRRAIRWLLEREKDCVEAHSAADTFCSTSSFA
jgi:DNA-binding NarL/FixJ family response regulator